MGTRGRRRLLAVAIVLASFSSALALQIWPQASNPQSNPAIPVSSPGRVVFSIRNNNNIPIQIVMFQKQGGVISPGSAQFVPAVDCAPMSLPYPLDPNVSAQPTLQPNEQVQFVVDSTGYASEGDKQCTFDVVTSPSMLNPSVSVTFHVVSGEDVDVQPVAMSFGSQTSSNTESQAVAVTSWGGASQATLQIINDMSNHFVLEGCGGSNLCTISLPNNGGFGSANVHCVGSNSQFGSATLLVYNGATMYGQLELQCTGSGSGSGIYLMPMTLFQSAPLGDFTTDTISVMGSGSLTNVAITGGGGTLGIQQCGGQASCTLATTLPTTLTIVCTPTSATQTATLQVTGGAGSASASLTCAPIAGPGVLYVAPTTFTFTDTIVNGESSTNISVENHGGADLTNVVLSLTGTDGSHFAFDGCSASAPCTVVAGTPMLVPVYFRPLAHGLKQTQLAVTADGGSGSGSGSATMTTTNQASVSLAGTGIGGVMVVTSPPGSGADPYHLDLGTLPLNQVATALVTVRNDGNASFNATITGAASPLTVSPTSDDVSTGSSTDYTVTCSSPTPSPATNQIWQITSGAYIGAPQDITVSCAVADTNVIVDPLAFDFFEIRTGAPTETRTLTVTNPGPGATTITSMQLRSSRTGLSLDPPMTMMMLAPNTSVTATLKLETGSDTDLTDEYIDIAVGSATLALPVRGKVVTAHSRIAPEKLDLGTACVGTQVTGTVRLINDGTATLSVARPEMDADARFLASTPGVMYPFSLPAGMEVTAQVSPTAGASGEIAGMLTWRDDVPATYEVPIALEYVTSGTALSPRGLDFGAVAVDMPSSPQRVTLENCDPEPTTIKVKSLRGLKGPIGAWMLEPRVGYTKVLAAHETQAVLVTFNPPARGHYEAELVVETTVGEQKILLVGDASGRDFGETSFYSCACNTPGAPWRGWPLVLAIVFVSVRRRRGSSSPR